MKIENLIPFCLISVRPFAICLCILTQGCFSFQVQPSARLGGSLFTLICAHFQGTSLCQLSVPLLSLVRQAESVMGIPV